MNYLAATLLAIFSNLDDLGAGAALGLASVHPSFQQGAAIALVSGLTLGVGMQAGEITASLLAPRYASLLSLAVFAGIAAYFFLAGSKTGAQPGPGRYPARLSTGAVWSLALALGLDSLALGVPAGLAAYPPVFTPAMGFLSSFVLFCAGNRLARRIVQPRWRRKARLAAGSVFLVLAGLEACSFSGYLPGA